MPATDTPTTSPAAELNTAAVRLRCDHTFPCNPPGGTLLNPGPCTHCSIPFKASAAVADHLRAPLAAWLENAAWWASQPPGANRYALDLARAINGTRT
jgi:hypothetical protein